jgi:hypothetical protein
MAGSVAGTLITVAPTGAEADKAAVPALPVTLAELVVTEHQQHLPPRQAPFQGVQRPLPALPDQA